MLLSNMNPIGQAVLEEMTVPTKQNYYCPYLLSDKDEKNKLGIPYIDVSCRF